MGMVLLKRLFALALVALPVGAVAQVSVSVYGNWCGLDYPQNPYTAQAPIDALDTACMRHDYCTAVQGRFDCGCDLALMDELRHTRWPDPYQQSTARSIYDSIAVLPCTDPLGTVQKQSLFMQDMLGDMAKGNAAPMDAMARWWQLLSEIR